MEGPWTRAVNIITFGGAKVDANKVKTKGVVVDKTTGKKMYEITFTTGAKVKYPNQAAGNNSAINILTPDESLADADHIEINRFYGLEFTGTDRKEDISLNGSKNCTINVQDKNKLKKYEHNDTIGKNDDSVNIAKSKYKNKYYKSSENSVVMDNFDTMYYPGGYAVGPGVQKEKDTVNDLH